MSKPAALPMYDLAGIRSSTDALWRGIRSEFAKIGFDADRTLDRQSDITRLWSDPDLGLSQTCGLPYATTLRDKVTLIGTPDYGILPDQPGWYNSVIIARNNDSRGDLKDFAGATFAYNGANSQSGLYAIMFEIQSAFGNGCFFDKCHKSGGHVLSAKAVIQGQADIAAIDAVTWRYLQHLLPDCDQLKVLGTTSPGPGLPYISGNGNDETALADAIETAIGNLLPADKMKLGIKGLWRSRPEDYDIILERATLSAAVIAAHGIR